MDPEFSSHQSLQERNERVARQIKAARAELGTAQKQLAQTIESEFTNEHLRSQMLQQAESLVRSIQDNLAQLEEQLLLLRLPTLDELAYRKRLLESFSQIVGSKSESLKGVRYHGANWRQSAMIVKSGEISSSQERGMDRSSLDVGGQISVTDAESVELSLRDYTGIGDFLLPMGCLFVIQTDAAKKIGNTYAMESVRFRSEPGAPKVSAILVSGEMLSAMKRLLQENGLPSDLAQEYNDYLQRL